MFANVFNAGKDFANKITNKFLNLSEVEAKIKEATNDDNWGPSGSLMKEIADETFCTTNFHDVMTFLWYRIFSERPQSCRRTYKGLVLLSYLVVNGSDYVAVSCKTHLGDINRLKAFTDAHGVADLSIRRKASDIYELLSDAEKLQSERSRASTYKARYYGSETATGLSGDGGGFSGQHLGNFDDWNPEPKSIPFAIGESFINFVSTFTHNISGPPPTETHDNFDIPPLDNMDADHSTAHNQNYLTSFKTDKKSTVPKTTEPTSSKPIDANVELTKPTKVIPEVPIIDFSDAMVDNSGMQNVTKKQFVDSPLMTDSDFDLEFNNLRALDNSSSFINVKPVASTSMFSDFQPDFDNLRLVHVATTPINASGSVIQTDTSSIKSEPSVSNSIPKNELKIGATWNELDSLKIDLNNLCGRRKHLSSKS